MKELYLICKQMSETNNVEDYERQEIFIKENIENINSEMLTNIIINGSRINSLSTIELLNIAENKIESKDFINIVKSVNKLENLSNMNDFLIRKDIIDSVYNSTLFNIDNVKNFIFSDIIKHNKLWLLKNEYMEKIDKVDALKGFFHLLFKKENNKYITNIYLNLNKILNEKDINKDFCSDIISNMVYGYSIEFENIKFINDLSILFNFRETENKDPILFEQLNYFLNNKKNELTQFLEDKKQNKEHTNKSSLDFFVGKTFINSVILDNIFKTIKPYIKNLKNKNNENIYYFLFEKHGFFEAMSFYNFEFIDLLFEKNIYNVSAIDILISKKNIVDLSWLLYFLEKSKISEEMSKEKEQHIKKIKNIIEDQIEENLETELYNLFINENDNTDILENKDFEKIKEILDEKIKEKNTVKLEEIIFACIELFDKKNEFSKRTECLTKIKMLNGMSYPDNKIIGIAATILYFNHFQNENAFDIYTSIISEIENIDVIRTTFTYLLHLSEKKKNPLNLDQKKAISFAVLNSRERSDSDREIIINSVTGYSIFTKDHPEIKDDKKALALIQKVQEKTKSGHIYSLNIEPEEDKKPEQETLFFNIYTDKDVEELEKNLNEFRKTTDPSLLWIKKLKSVSGKKKLAINTDLKLSLDKLRIQFPNFEKFIDFLENNYYLNSLGNNEFYFPPSLLNGPAGIGKTFFLSSLAKAAKTSYKMISMESITANFMLTGSSSLWENGCPGEFFNSAITSEYANNILLLDEIDKCERGHFSVENALLPLLEKHTAQSFRDEYIPLKLDISKMIWLATSNNLNEISVPIRSRFEVFDIKSPNFEERKLLAQSIYSTLLENNHWGKGFVSHVNESVLDCLCEDDASSRDLRKNITRALAKSAARETAGSLKELIIDDIEQNKKHEIIELWDRKFN